MWVDEDMTEGVDLVPQRVSKLRTAYLFDDVALLNLSLEDED
jgi:hypothetical protein